MKKAILSLVSKFSKILPDWMKRSLYKLGPFSKLIRRFLNTLVPSGFSTVSIAAGYLSGMYLCLDMKEEKDYWLGTYEPDLLEMIRKKVCSGWVAYDVGANIGYLSLALAKAVGDTGKVYAFEALPENIERLEVNLKMNQMDSMVEIIPAAIIETSKKTNFLIGPSGAMGKALGSEGRSGIHGKTIEVIGISLDDFVYLEGNPPPDLVKMDIEGGEVLALKGMTRLLVDNPPIIFLELHGLEASSQVWDILVGVGFQMFRLKPNLPLVRSREELNWKEYLVAYP